MNSVQSLKIQRFKHMLSLIFASQRRVLSVLFIVFEVLLLSISLVLPEDYDALFFTQLYFYIASIISIVTSICNDLKCFISLGYRRKEIHDNIFKIFLGISFIASILVILFLNTINLQKEGIVFLGIVFSKLNLFSNIIIFLLSFVFFISLSVFSNDLSMMGFLNMRYQPLVFIALWILIKKFYSFKPFMSKLSIPLFIIAIAFIYLSYKYGLKAFKNKDVL